MGIFSVLKKLFNKNIECGDEINGHIVYAVPLKGRIVNVGANIVVNEGYSAVFVVNDRVSDVIPSGKHKIGGAVLPETFSKLKLDKADKNGNYQKKFKADIYFVLNKPIEKMEYTSNEPFFLKSEKFGRVKGYSEGLCDFQIVDPEKLFKVLLIDRPFVTTKEAKSLISILIGNEVNEVMERIKLEFSNIIINPKILNEYLNPEINNRTESFGVNANNVEVASLKLTRRLQKKVTEFIAERGSVERQFENSGIKYQPEPVVMPEKVDISTSLQQEKPVQFENASNPQIIRRGGNVSAPVANTNYETSNINSGAELMQNGDKKVCKFCGQTIDVNYSFCPKCGFKQ